MGLLGKKHKVEKNKNIVTSFTHAYEGIKHAVFRERNMHIHLIMAGLVIFFGAVFRISRIEWFICLILIGLVIAFELINTAIEACVDLTTTKENDLARIAKDVSAGAVLVVSFVSAVIGLAIFLPRFFEFLGF